MKIGVLAVQGAFLEHEKMILALAEEFEEKVECVEIRQKKDLDGIDGIVLPGGESTVQGKLLRELDLFDDIREKITGGMPVLATCAGLILLAKNIENDETKHLATLPVSVERNAYGRQLGSFVGKASVGEIEDYPLVFIRAPYVTKTEDAVSVLTTLESKVVGVEYNNQIGLAFHPEMTDDLRIHRYFLKRVQTSH